MSTHPNGQLQGLVSRFAGGLSPQQADGGRRTHASPASRRHVGPLWLRAACLALCTWLVDPLVPSVHAQDYAAAGQFFDAAQEAFQKGDFKRAAQQYQAAHTITKDPALLFSIGESWQRAGDAQKALDAYRAYLKEQPTAGDRPEVEKRIKALEEVLAAPAVQAPATGGTAGTAAAPAAGTATPSGTAAVGTAEPAAATPAASQAPAAVSGPAAPEAKAESKAEAPPTITPPVGEKPTALRTAAWVGTAAAVALGTAGAIVGLGAQNRADELRRRTTLLVGTAPPQYDENQAEAYTTLMSEGQSYNTVSIALLSAAGVATVASVVLFVVDFRLQAKRAQARAATQPSVAWQPGVDRRRLPAVMSKNQQPVLLAGSF